MNLYKFIYLKGVYVTIKRPYSLNVLLLNIADAIVLNLCVLSVIFYKKGRYMNTADHITKKPW